MSLLLDQDGREKVLPEGTFEGLEEHLDGRLIRPGDRDYDEARSIWNEMIDRKPAIIARCLTSNDVVGMVKFVAKHRLRFSVRSGGHNIAGNAICDDGVVIDLSQMKDVEIDHQQRRARVQPGANWGDFDAAAQVWGLATPGGIVSTTGTAGFTLGGGFGHLTRKHGYTVDNLLGVEIVTADGRLLRADDEQNSDLFWAIRGGGGNFGIVTSFEYRLHPVGPELLAGMVLYPMTEAASILKRYRDYMANAPEELGTLVALRIAPPAPFLPTEIHGEPVVIVVASYFGPLDEAQRAVAPLRELGTPLVDLLRTMPYTAHQKIFDAGQPPGRQQYWKSDYFSNLTDETIDTVVSWIDSITSPLSVVLLIPLDGAGNRVDVTATAYAHRSATYAINVSSQWIDAAESQRHIEWTRNFWQALRMHGPVGTYGNFLTGDEGEDRMREAYGPNYERLADIKQRYDPDNLFRLNWNIRPREA